MLSRTLSHALAAEGYGSDDYERFRQVPLRPYHSTPLIVVNHAHRHSLTYLTAAVASSPPNGLSEISSSLSPVLEDYSMEDDPVYESTSGASGPRSWGNAGIDSSQVRRLFEAVATLSLQEWTWVNYKPPSKSSLSQESANALNVPVEIYYNDEPDAWSAIQGLLRDRWNRLAVSRKIRKEMDRLLAMDEDYKNDHGLTNENGLNHHSAVALARLLELLAKELDPTALLEAAGERDGNTVDWMVNLRVDHQERSARCALAIEFKPCWNANPEHFEEIERFAKASTVRRPAKLYHVEQAGIFTSTELDPHCAGLLAQLLGYMRRFQIPFGCLYNGDSLIAFRRKDDNKFFMLPPLLAEPPHSNKFVLAMMALTNAVDQEWSEEELQMSSYASLSTNGEFFAGLAEDQESEVEEEMLESGDGDGQGEGLGSSGTDIVTEDVEEDADEDIDDDEGSEEDVEMKHGTDTTYVADDDVTEEDYDYESDQSEA